ncbi:MAG: hypothetical protein OXI43_08470 [Candidatus Poribacteria bacterium]|nr:hypothetical protein [Candidatus Poribacteria bacterium]
MKRFTIYTLIFAIFSCTVISLFAYNDKAKKTVNKYWAGCIAEDADGPLSANANIEVNIEYPGERGIGNAIQNFFRGHGVEYYASASVSGRAPNDDYEGAYDLYASVCFDDDAKSNTWRRKVDEDVAADDFVKLDEDLTNWDTIRAINELYPWAYGDISGSSPAKNFQKWVNLNYQDPDIAPNPYESPSTDNWQLVNMHRPALSHNAVADVWNFSFSDATEWNCFFSGDTTCHECN